MIGDLTNDMIRLCGEITTLRENRAVLRSRLSQGRNDLTEAVSRMRADLRNSREELAARTKTELRSFLEDVQGAVAELKQDVASFKNAFLGDLAGAGRAWGGHGSMPAPLRMTAKEPAKEFPPKARKKKH